MLNLNNWLCKYFKTEDKDYVEVWDIIYSNYNIYYILFPFMLGIIYFIIKLPTEVTDPLVDIMRVIGTNNIYFALFKIWFAGFIPIIAIRILYSICKIKIAKCNLKET